MLMLDGVDVYLEGAQVLRSASLSLAPGETVALVGRNGAGKTTTLRTVMGFVRPSSGSIRLGDTLLDGIDPHRRPLLGIGYAPEDRRLFSAFSVEQNIVLPARVARLGAAEAAERLAMIHRLLPELSELGPRPAGTVSGGQGKMVALGRALMAGRSLLLLDEPFQGLAPALARRYAEALGQLRALNPRLTVLVTESNPDLLGAVVNRVLSIERGAVEESAPASVTHPPPDRR